MIRPYPAFLVALLVLFSLLAVPTKAARQGIKGYFPRNEDEAPHHVAREWVDEYPIVTNSKISQILQLIPL
jgi:hypothetical protein